MFDSQTALKHLFEFELIKNPKLIIDFDIRVCDKSSSVVGVKGR